MAVVNNAARNGGVQTSAYLCPCFQFWWGIHPELEVLNHIIILFNLFEGKSSVFIFG